MSNIDNLAEYLLDIVLIRNRENAQKRDKQKKYMKDNEKETFTQEEKENIIKLYNLNLSKREIANRLHISRKKVQEVTKDLARIPFKRSYSNARRRLETK